jgi:hypothetical protein
MTLFKIQDAFAGTAIGFGPNYPSIEIALDAGQLKQHGTALVLSEPLPSDRKIDDAINAFQNNLEALGAAAKQRLIAYRDRSR